MKTFFRKHLFPREISLTGTMISLVGFKSFAYHLRYLTTTASSQLCHTLQINRNPKGIPIAPYSIFSMISSIPLDVVYISLSDHIRPDCSEIPHSDCLYTGYSSRQTFFSLRAQYHITSLYPVSAIIMQQ